MAISANAVSLTFFASPTELATWLGEWVRRYRLRSLVLPPAPSRDFIDQLDWDDLPRAADVLRQSSFVYLNRGPIATKGMTRNLIPFRNPGVLRLILPHRHKRGLGWSHLGSTGSKPDIAGIWHAIRDDVVSKTRPGVWFVTPTDPEPGLSEDVRYTDGAEGSLAQGTRIFHMGDVEVHHFGLSERSDGGGRGKGRGSSRASSSAERSRKERKPTSTKNEHRRFTPPQKRRG